MHHVLFGNMVTISDKSNNDLEIIKPTQVSYRVSSKLYWSLKMFLRTNAKAKFEFSL